MKNFTYIILIYFFSIWQSDAQVNNKQWIFGYGDDIENKFGLTCLDFNNHEINLYPYAYQNEILNIGMGSTFVCDSSGQIAIISDNCSIYDHQLNIISGGEQMHTNQFSQGYCNDGIKLFDLPLNIMFPSKSSNSKFYQIYKDINFEGEPDRLNSQNLILNIFTKNSLGIIELIKHDSLSKNRSLAMINSLPYYSLYHRKWLFHSILNNSNKFNFYALNDVSDKIDTFPTQQIGNILNVENLQLVPGLFSPDYKSYCNIVTDKGLQVFDYDDETIQFSNHRDIYFPVFRSDRHSLGICYSPNSRFVYVSTLGGSDSLSNTNFIYQIDLANNTSELLATFFAADETGWPIGIGSINQGPDCRLYVSTGSTTNWLHVIHYPDRKGVECMFQPKAIDLPTTVFISLPYILNSGNTCDSTYNWPFELSNHKIKENLISISTYPNPCSDVLFLQVSEINPKGWTIQLFDLQGKIAKRPQTLLAYTSEIDISRLGTGIYIYVIRNKNGKYIHSGKVLKE